MSGQGIAPDPRLRGRPDRARVPARPLHGAGLRDRRSGVRWLVRRSSAASTGSCAPTRRREQDWKSYAKTRARLQRRLLRRALRDPAPAGPPVPEPGPPAGRAVAHRAEHDRELRHEHELAVLRRRVHDVVPDADGRAGRAAVRLGRRRDGRARRGHPRARAPVARRSSATSGSTSTARSSTSCCRSSLDPRGDPALAGRAADVRRARDRARRSRARADDRARPGRADDRDQAARDERRRLLQLELGRARSRTRTG